jgi:LAO/AO transport system kinase
MLPLVVRRAAAIITVSHSARQAQAWMWNEISETLMARFRAHPEVAAQVTDRGGQVRAGLLTPAAAARALLAAFLGSRDQS